MQLAIVLLLVFLGGRGGLGQVRPIIEELDSDAAELFRQAEEIGCALAAFSAAPSDAENSSASGAGTPETWLAPVADIADEDIKRALAGYFAAA